MKDKIKWIIYIAYLFIVLFVMTVCSIVGVAILLFKFFQIPIWIGVIIWLICQALLIPILIQIDKK